jgi:type I pantothenate kinase
VDLDARTADLTPVVDLIVARLPPARPAVVGLAGGVAVGKTTAAEALRAGLAPMEVAIVATDGFLLPNAELERRDLVARKGFPESYDQPAIREFLAAVRRGDAGVGAPLYSHETYDVVPDRRQSVDGSAVVVFEGVNALRYADLLDLAVYLDAAEADMEDWYARRFRDLCRDPPTGTFYAGFAGLGPDEVDVVARQVWRAVNLPNLREHIAPARAVADVVVEKRADHSVASIRLADVAA